MKWLIGKPINFISEIICIDKNDRRFLIKCGLQTKWASKKKKPIKWNASEFHAKFTKWREAKFAFARFEHTVEVALYFCIFLCLVAVVVVVVCWSSLHIVAIALRLICAWRRYPNLTVAIFANCVKSHKTAMNWWIIAKQANVYGRIRRLSM